MIIGGVMLFSSNKEKKDGFQLRIYLLVPKMMENIEYGMIE